MYHENSERNYRGRTCGKSLLRTHVFAAAIPTFLLNAKIFPQLAHRSFIFQPCCFPHHAWGRRISYPFFCSLSSFTFRVSNRFVCCIFQTHKLKPISNIQTKTKAHNVWELKKKPSYISRVPIKSIIITNMSLK